MAGTIPATPELSSKEAAELEKQNSPGFPLSNQCLLIFPQVESYQGGDTKNTEEVP